MKHFACLAAAWRPGRYYRTYPAFVQDEVEDAPGDPGSQFQPGPQMAICMRKPAPGALIHHSDRGCQQYTSIRCSERLAGGGFAATRAANAGALLGCAYLPMSEGGHAPVA